MPEVYNLYHSHPGYDLYPAVNISAEAANLYCAWLTEKYNEKPNGKFKKVTFRIPTEKEWKKLGLRRKLYPDEGAPIWNGAILWRGTARAEPYLTARSMIMAGHEFQKFVCYPISTPEEDGKATINFIAERKVAADHAWRREDWNRPGDPADFLPRFEDWRFDWLDVPALIRAAEAVYEYPMVDRDPLPRWTEGRATLLGDAAHAMYPIGSNGASQAILDARVLTREILGQGTTPQAFAAYEAERRPATAKIVLANRQNGPEEVMQRVEELAPEGFARIEEVLTPGELEAKASAYKKLAGFDKDVLNSRPSIVTLPAAAS
jgi:hypothetical protein